MDRWNSVPEMMHSVRLAVMKLGLVMLSFALLSRDLPSVFGVVVGILLALWQFGSLADSVQRTVVMSKQQAEAHAVLRYLLRYGVIAAALAVSYFTAGVNFATVVIGLMSVKVVIIGFAIRTAVADGGAAYLRQLAQKRVRKEG